MGMLNASQKRTNRAPLTEALMSKQPAVNNKTKDLGGSCGRVVKVPNLKSKGRRFKSCPVHKAGVVLGRP